MLLTLLLVIIFFAAALLLLTLLLVIIFFAFQSVFTPPRPPSLLRSHLRSLLRSHIREVLDHLCVIIADCCFEGCFSLDPRHLAWQVVFAPFDIRSSIDERLHDFQVALERSVHEGRELIIVPLVHGSEIGRASCRERVSISVVAVS